MATETKSFDYTLQDMGDVTMILLNEIMRSMDEDAFDKFLRNAEDTKKWATREMSDESERGAKFISLMDMVIDRAKRGRSGALV